jgi:hypothetical protein
MPRWTRKRGEFLSKTRRITDGELLHLLAQISEPESVEFDERVYQSLQTVKSASAKALVWMAAAAALGILSHLKVLTRAGASGLEISPTVFAHAALVALSVSSMIFCFSYCKQSFLHTWFAWKLKDSSPSEKVRYLLRYPDAYRHFAFLPASIGYPRFMFANRNNWPQMVYLVLVVIGLVTCSLASMWLWAQLALDVWTAPNVNKTLSVLIIALSGAVTLLGWFSPFYYDFPRLYTHYGLVDLLGRREGERSTAAHLKIRRCAERMDLVEKSEQGT